MIAAAVETTLAPAIRMRTRRMRPAAPPNGHAPLVRLMPPRQTPQRLKVAAGVSSAALETTDGDW